MPRFVVLYHELDLPGRLPHFDLMLEIGGALWTWELPQWPLGVSPVSVMRLPNHRLAYLDYQGPVSNGRGSVRLVERGDLELEVVSDEHLQGILKGSSGQSVFTAEHITISPEGDYWSVAVRTIDAIRKMGPCGENT